jgi:uncharacterized membrane protein YkoI
MLAMVALSSALVLACGEGSEEGEENEAAEASEKTTQVATVSEDSARVIALAQVPGGTVTKHELEEENGTLIHSFDIKVAGKEGIEEIHIDAKTGAFLKKAHETDAQVKAEAKADSATKPPPA